jgi:hypothetical protein
MSVLDRIEVDIIDMAFEIGVVANGMLPITSLPYTPFRVLKPGSASEAPRQRRGKTQF